MLVSVEPKRYEKETDSLHYGLGETDSPISVRPKCYEGKHRVCNPISVRPRSLSVRPKRLGFLAVAMSTEFGGAGWIKSVGPSLTFGLEQMWI